MTQFADSYARWLGDYYLLATVLLALTLVGIALRKQPAQRLAIAKSTLISLVLLAVLCAIPGWSIVHLLTDVGPLPESHDEFSATPVARTDRALPIVFGASAAAPDDRATPRTPSVDFHFSWPALFATTHLAGAACIALWLTLGWFASARLRRTARPAPSELIAILNEVFRQTDGNLQRPRLLTHDRIDVAVALGAWRPTILLPSHWLTQIPLPNREGLGEGSPVDNLRTVLAHESTHILNHDLRWVGLTRILFIALWANPLFWLTRRLLRRDQEALADAAAAELTSRQRYAEQLVAWARDVQTRPALHLSSAVGLWEGPSQLRQRIAILLNERLIILRNCSRRWQMVTAVASIAAAAALSMLTLQPSTRANEKVPPSEQPPLKGSTDTKTAKLRELRARFKPNVITGRVVDEKNQPIAGAEVLLFRINRIDNSRKLQAKTTTDADGKYRFENVIDIPKEFPDKKFLPLNPLEEEFVQVYVRAPGRVAGMGMDLRQRIASTGEVFDMTLNPAATLTGRVTGPDDKAVAGALVMVGNFGFSAWEEVSSARTKADGTYTINDVAPYGMDEYRKKEAEQRKRSMDTFAKKSKDSYSFYVMPPVMVVEHPDFAIKRANYDKIPGTQDLKLEPAAIIEGRVQFGDSGKPAAGAVVHLATSRSNDTLPKFPESMSLHYVDARADAEGKYKFAMLPAASYDLSAEMPGWVNIGIDAFPAASGKTSTAPNLILTKGGVISIRLIDDKTGKPIELTPDVRADISAHQFPFTKRLSRPNWTPNAAANSAGRFELHALPGKRAVFVSNVRAGEKMVWAGKTSAGDMKPPAVVDVVEGKTVDVDIPVVEANKPTITGTFVPLPLAPTEDSEPQTKPKPASDHRSDKKNGANQPVNIPIVVAKHVLLLDGKTITTWKEIDAKIAALPDPSNAYPHFYITHGAMESGVEKDAKPHFFELHRKYKLKGHSEGSLAARTSFRYDKIRNQADLVPDESLRVEGAVVGSDGKPVAGAEVVLITPVDESLSYKEYDIAIVEGRIRNRVDEVVTDTDAAGWFAIYPPKRQKYSLIALHPSAGFNFARDVDLTASRKVNLVSWASLVSEFAAEPGAKQSASIRTRMPAATGYPAVTIDQYSSDLKRDQSARLFGFTHVPPIFQTTIQRDFAEPDGGAIGVSGASVGLLPGEERRLDLGPLSDKQRELLKWQRDEAQKRIDATRQRTE